VKDQVLENRVRSGKLGFLAFPHCSSMKHQRWPRFWDYNGSLLKDLHEGDVIVLGKDFRSDFHFTDVDLTQDFLSIWERYSKEDWPEECSLLNCKERRPIAVPVSLMNKQSMEFLFIVYLAIELSSPNHDDPILKKLKSNVTAVVIRQESQSLCTQRRRYLLKILKQLDHAGFAIYCDG
jgi:hypothetical protein